MIVMRMAPGVILLLTNASVDETMVVTELWVLNLRRGCTLTVYHGLGRMSSAKVLRVWVDSNDWVWSRSKVLRVGLLVGCWVLRVCGV